MIDTDPQSLSAFKKKPFFLPWRWFLSQHPSTVDLIQPPRNGWKQVEDQKEYSNHFKSIRPSHIHPQARRRVMLRVMLPPRTKEESWVRTMSLGGPRFALLWVARKVVGNEGMKLYTGYAGDATSRNFRTFRFFASGWDMLGLTAFQVSESVVGWLFQRCVFVHTFLHFFVYISPWPWGRWT